MNIVVPLLSLLFALPLVAGEKTKSLTLCIEGVHCQSCAKTVEKALQKVHGVSKAKVILEERKATIVLAGNTSTASFIKAVSDAGFSASEGDNPAKSKKETKSSIQHLEGKNGCCDDECEAPDKETIKTKAKEL